MADLAEVSAGQSPGWTASCSLRALASARTIGGSHCGQKCLYSPQPGPCALQSALLQHLELIPLHRKCQLGKIQTEELRDAISDANAGELTEVLYIPADTHLHLGGEQLSITDHANVTIMGGAGATIDGDMLSPIFWINASLSLIGLSLIRAWHSTYAAVFTIEEFAVGFFVHCLIDSSYTETANGIYNSGILEMISCTMRNMTSAGVSAHPICAYPILPRSSTPPRVGTSLCYHYCISSGHCIFVPRV